MQGPRAAGCPVAGADGPDRGAGSHPCAFRGVADAKNPRNVYLAAPLRGSAARDRGRRGFRAHETAGFWKRALHPGARRLPRGIHNPDFLHLARVKPSGAVRLASGTGFGEDTTAGNHPACIRRRHWRAHNHRKPSGLHPARALARTRPQETIRLVQFGVSESVLEAWRSHENSHVRRSERRRSERRTCLAKRAAQRFA